MHKALFQSTLSMRRATVVDAAHFVAIVISIHALHEESDVGRGTITARPRIFQSTLSMRRATREQCALLLAPIPFQSTLSMRRATYGLIIVSTTDLISIHALHEESDIKTPVNSSRK